MNHHIHLGNTTLTLYITADCHLCEQAQRLIHAALGCPVAERDIADNDALLHRYGLRIPVLRRGADGHELNWPFTAGQVRALIERATADHEGGRTD